MGRPGIQLYFSYGSNNLQQLAERVGRKTPFVHEPGVLKNHIRTFAGYSRRWDGGVASFYPRKGAVLEGVVVHMTPDELALLDKFEGGYVRIRKRVQVPSKPDGYVYAHIYLKTNQVFSKMPSDAYLEAIHRNVRLDEIPIYGIRSGARTVKKEATWVKGIGIVHTDNPVKMI